MHRHPLAEVFGFPVTNASPEATRARRLRLCPYNNVRAQCTKNSESDPLGVCSVFADDHAVITCPVRFRQDWLMLEDAAEFFFPPNTRWAAIPEVSLDDASGQSAGKIDFVIAALDAYGRITDFGALEVQSVYISGNIGNPFRYFMDHQHEALSFDWIGQRSYPKPDYLSSSRKRLAPQLLYKGGILHAWGKKLAVALDDALFGTLPSLSHVEPASAEVAWLVYHLTHEPAQDRFRLQRSSIVHTAFDDALNTITRATPGSLTAFIAALERKLATHGPQPLVSGSLEEID